MNLGGVGKKTHVNDEHLIGSDGRLSTGWRVVIVSVLAMIVGPPSVLILSFGLFLPEFQAAFGWSIQAISVGATLMSLILVVIAPLQGYLVDRLGCRTLLLISIPPFRGRCAVHEPDRAAYQHVLYCLRARADRRPRPLAADLHEDGLHLVRSTTGLRARKSQCGQWAGRCDHPTGACASVR